MKLSKLLGLICCTTAASGFATNPNASGGPADQITIIKSQDGSALDLNIKSLSKSKIAQEILSLIQTTSDTGNVSHSPEGDAHFPSAWVTTYDLSMQSMTLKVPAGAIRAKEITATSEIDIDISGVAGSSSFQIVDNGDGQQLNIKGDAAQLLFRLMFTNSPSEKILVSTFAEDASSARVEVDVDGKPSLVCKKDPQQGFECDIFVRK